MQIVIGLDNALASLNGNPIETVKVELIGGGDSRVRATSGAIPLDPDMHRRGFYETCCGMAYADLRKKEKCHQ